MNTVKKHDAGLIVAGVLLVLCAFLPHRAGGRARHLTAIAGAAFLVSGVFDIIDYVRFRTAMNLSGWAVAYGCSTSSSASCSSSTRSRSRRVIPWVMGAFFFALFGAVEIAARCASARWARRCGAGCCSRAS